MNIKVRAASLAEMAIAAGAPFALIDLPVSDLAPKRSGPPRAVDRQLAAWDGVVPEGETRQQRRVRERSAGKEQKP